MFSSAGTRLNGPTRLLRTLVTDYGMVLVLLALMIVFSLLTIREQRPTGRDAGREISETILSMYDTDIRVFIAATGSPDDRTFADTVRERLAERRVHVVGVVTGAPVEARRILETVFAGGEQIDLVVLTGATAEWKIFDRFPQLPSGCFVQPRSGRWPDFLKRTNLIGVANQTAIYAVIAIGMTMVIITGGIDLSVGSLVALSSVVATVLIRDFGSGVLATPLWVIAACIAGVLTAAAAGFINGMLVTRGGLPAFIVTLAMMLMAGGLALRLADYQSINAVPESFRWLGGESTAGLPNPVLVMFAFYGLAHFVMNRTVFGRLLYAIGGNAAAARLSGIRVERTKNIVYTISGALAGLGGIMVSSRLNAGDPKYGDMYELEVIAAVVVGGTSLMGGEGRIFGTLVGAFIIAVIRNGMNLMSVESANQKIVLGAVLLAAVLLDRIRRRATTRFS